jgi:hypothetical protein
LLRSSLFDISDAANVGGRPVEFGVKTRTSRRAVDLDKPTMARLERWCGRLRRETLHGADDSMFCNAQARFLTPKSVSQPFGRVVSTPATMAGTPADSFVFTRS